MQILNELLDNVRVGDPQMFHGVQIFPLLSSNGGSVSFLELDEALEQGLAEVTEVSEGGSIPELTVINRAPQDIIIFDGEQLIGAKQNRIVNITVVVPAKSTLPIPVSCVEQGRWDYRSRSFAAGASFAYPSLRVSKHEDVTQNLKSRSRSDSDQSRIWNDISAKAKRMDVACPTLAMAAMYESRVPSAEVLSEAFSVEENQIGYVAFIKGGFAGSDLFGSAEVCRRKMEKLLGGYYLDSLDDGVAFARLEIDDVLREVRSAEHHDFGTVGKGKEIRFDTLHVQGSWKEVDGFIPHLTILPKSVG